MEQEKENSIQLSTATAPTMKQPRNCAFDIARIVAMFLIVSSHFLGHGGFANNMTGANFVFGRILTSLFNPSVNLFVLIGAYFTCTSKKLKWQRLAKLYAQVWIYSMTLFVVFLCIYGKDSFSWNWLLSSLFPVICGKYWFFSAYIFMMLASPLLNVVIARIDKKTHFAACAVFIVLGILAGDVHVLPQLAMGDGYNVIWFIMLANYRIQRDFDCRILLQHRTMLYRAFGIGNHSACRSQRRENHFRALVEICHVRIRNDVWYISYSRQQRNARIYVSKHLPCKQILRF